MTQVAPLPEGRSGSIPQVLHEIITPTVTYQLCNKTLTSTLCPVRHGIAHNNDSLMSAIVYALNKKSKKELVSWIKRNIDPLDFLSLENGHIVAAFVDRTPSIVDMGDGMVKELKRFLDKYPTYVRLMGIGNIEADEIKMARELQVYKAWLRFFAYLESDEPKNPHHLYDLFHRLGYLLVVWDKDNAQDVQLRCPKFTSVDSLLHNMESHRSTIMLLFENGVYEPIELRKRNNEGQTVLDTKYTTTVDNALLTCGRGYRDIVATLRTLQEWIHRSLFHPTPFLFQSCVLSPDLKVVYVATRGRFLIKLSDPIPIGSLPALVKELDVKYVIHQEDVAGTIHEVQVLQKDFDLFSRKLQSIGLGYELGRINPNAHAEGYYSTILTMRPPTAPPTILVAVKNDITSFANQESKISKKWFQVQTMIGQTLLAHYETLVVPLLSKSRTKRIETLARTFPAITDRKIVVTTLEEIPIEHGKDAIAQWVRLIGYDDKYPFFDQRIQETSKEWKFSQQAVEQNVLADVSSPVATNGARPAAHETPVEYKVQLANNTLQDVDAERDLPDILSSDRIDKKSLPSKWTKMRAYDWAKYVVLYHRQYDRNHIPNLIEWIAATLKVPVQWGDVQYIRYKYVVGALQDKDVMIMLLEDPSLRSEMSRVYGKSFNTPLKVWGAISKRTRDEAKRVWNDISVSGRLWASDLDLYTAAKLLGITVLVFHRSKYGVAKDGRKRGDLDDIIVSSSLYTRTYTKSHVAKMPICIFYKDTEDDKAVYSPITDQKGTFLFKSLQYCPQDIHTLVDYLIDHGKSALYE
jgi:hypothetical protein